MKLGVLSIVYSIIALLSILLLIVYFIFDKKKNRLLLALFACVAISNSGYFLLAISKSLLVAKVANIISYFGGAFSLLVMLYIIYDVCQIPKRKRSKWFFGVVSTAFFSLAASSDWLGLYYKSMHLEVINGTTHLIKEYGPLHNLYILYLLSYVIIMLFCIAYATKNKHLSSRQYTLFLFVAVLLNVVMWLIEQTAAQEFEFLSVSYIITEILLLLIYDMLCDYGVISSENGVLSVQMLTQINTRQINPSALPSGIEEMFKSFAERTKTLSSAEKRILNYYIEGYDIAQIPQLAFISIHTVKKHNHSIYQKLEISSRDELMLYIEMFRSCGRLEELTGKVS